MDFFAFSQHKKIHHHVFKFLEKVRPLLLIYSIWERLNLRRHYASSLIGPEPVPRTLQTLWRPRGLWSPGNLSGPGKKTKKRGTTETLRTPQTPRSPRSPQSPGTRLRSIVKKFIQKLPDNSKFWLKSDPGALLAQNTKRLPPQGLIILLGNKKKSGSGITLYLVRTLNCLGVLGWFFWQ